MLKEYLTDPANMETIIQLGIIITIGLIQSNILIEGLKNNTKKDAGFLTSLGIFGTFLGISVGLWFFNPNDIQNSVNGLLGGMKIAFTSSVSGLFGYLLLNQKVDDITESEDIGIGDVVSAINTGNESLLDRLGVINNSVNELDNSITGDGEGSLLNQMVLLRSNMNDKFQDLNSEFKDFAKLQAENNTKALVKAIEDVIGDFNAKINEQFGENFKELNAAVGDLVGWQENYKEILEKTLKQFDIAVESIDKSKLMLESIEEQYEGNMKINKDVKKSLEGLQNGNDDLYIKLEAFSDLATKAEDAFPVIEGNIDNLTSGFSSKVEESIGTVTTFLESQNDQATSAITGIQDSLKKTISTLSDSINDSTNTVKQSSETISNSVTNSIKELNESSIEIAEGIKSSTESVLDKLNDSIDTSNEIFKESSTALKSSIEDSVSDLTTSIDEGFKSSITNINQIQQQITENLENNLLQMDDALRQELEKSLQSLGVQLASLSQKFVDDYKELTSRMKTVVEIAES